jgi:hypothetical protein
MTMKMKTIDCVDCGEAVPYGRLSCPACGTLLASVTGGRSKAARTAHVPPVPAPDPEQHAPSAMATAEPDATPGAAVEPDLGAETDHKAAAVAVGAVAVGAATHAVAAASRLVTLATRRLSEPEPDDEPPTPWGPLEAPEPVLIARPYQRQDSLRPDPTTWDAGLAGAYRPPTLTLASAAAMGAGSSSGSSTSAAHPASVVGSRSMDAGSGRSMVVDAAQLIEISGWFVVVGSAMAMLGFLLPWSGTVLGATGIGGYFDSWGLASPTHGFIVLGLLAVLALGILPTPVAAWLRSGVLGIAIGSLIVGLAWPYLVGSIGADIGVTVTALGGLALVIGGFVASWATRHAEPDPSV